MSISKAVWLTLKNKLIAQKRESVQKPLTTNEVQSVCKAALVSFNAQCTLLEIEPPLNVCGDIHGQFKDLLRLFNFGGYPPQTRYLFLGDYVDRGTMSLECILLLFLYKIRYSNRLYLLRGNHEYDSMNSVYGFKTEVEKRYESLDIWHWINETFSYMPVAALVSRRLFCMHGGLPMTLTDWNQVKSIKRPITALNNPIVVDLLWADPVPNQKGWRGSVRGVSYGFGEDVVYKFCRSMEIDMIVRAHQVVQNGFEFFASNRLVTIFSAPNYCGVFNNDAAMLTVSADLRCEVQQYRPPKKSERSKTKPLIKKK